MTEFYLFNRTTDLQINLTIKKKPKNQTPTLKQVSKTSPFYISQYLTTQHLSLLIFASFLLANPSFLSIRLPV